MPKKKSSLTKSAQVNWLTFGVLAVLAALVGLYFFGLSRASQGDSPFVIKEGASTSHDGVITYDIVITNASTRTINARLLSPVPTAEPQGEPAELLDVDCTGPGDSIGGPGCNRQFTALPGVPLHFTYKVSNQSAKLTKSWSHRSSVQVASENTDDLLPTSPNAGETISNRIFVTCAGGDGRNPGRLCTVSNVGF